MMRVSERCVDWAIQTRGAAHLVDAVTVHAIEDFRTDARENYLRLVIVLWAAKRMAEVGNMLEDYRWLFSDVSAKHLDGFLAAPQYTRGLRAVGLRAVEEADGRVRFEPRLTGWQNRGR